MILPGFPVMSGGASTLPPLAPFADSGNFQTGGGSPSYDAESWTGSWVNAKTSRLDPADGWCISSGSTPATVDHTRVWADGGGRNVDASIWVRSSVAPISSKIVSLAYRIGAGAYTTIDTAVLTTDAWQQLTGSSFYAPHGESFTIRLRGIVGSPSDGAVIFADDWAVSGS